MSASGKDLALSIVGLTRFVPGQSGFFGSKKASDSEAPMILRDVNLEIGEGETLGLVGESGCGKSTTARIASGLDSPDAGEVFLFGKSLFREGDAQREVQKDVRMIFQDPYSSLNPRHTVGYCLEEELIIGGVPKKERVARVLEIMELTGLSPDYRKRYPHQFSGGQRQRIAIARALVGNPRLVFCDEAVSALDVSVRAQILALLEELRERLKLTYLFISHDLSVVGYISRRVAVMYLGEIVEVAGVGELFGSPLHPYTAALIEAMPVPVPVGGIRDNPLRIEPPSIFNPPPGCPFHPACPKMKPDCAAVKPRMSEIGGRRVKCLLYE